MTESSTDWLIDWLTNSLTGWLIHLLTTQFNNWLPACFSYWPPDRFTDWLNTSLTVWLTESIHSVNDWLILTPIGELKESILQSQMFPLLALNSVTVKLLLSAMPQAAGGSNRSINEIHVLFYFFHYFFIEPTIKLNESNGITIKLIQMSRCNRRLFFN